jgi:hypothetical protein
MFLVTKDASVDCEAVGDGELLLDLGWTPVLVKKKIYLVMNRKR